MKKCRKPLSLRHFGTPGGGRTHGLSLRSAKNRLIHAVLRCYAVFLKPLKYKAFRAFGIIPTLNCQAFIGSQAPKILHFHVFYVVVSIVYPYSTKKLQSFLQSVSANGTIYINTIPSNSNCQSFIYCFSFFNETNFCHLSMKQVLWLFLLGIRHL